MHRKSVAGHGLAQGDSHVVLHVWREVCRHLEVHESAERLVPLLGGRLPLAGLIVRRWEADRAGLETVATAGSDAVAGKSSVSAADAADLVEWGRGGSVVRLPAGRRSAICGVGPAVVGLAGPLVDMAGTLLGLLCIVAPAGATLTPDHVALVGQLLEPFAAALENDSRLREMRALREALEADKRALLTRLDRQDITDSVVGTDTGLRDVMDRVNQVATSDAPVLVLGETGTGKEVVARAIHARSRRAHGPVLRVNCGAIPPDLVDSELFGHEKGSFTGASAERKGWFERADGGTLFLDEVGELPPAAQVRLLRILQDGTFERVGGQRPLTVDVRLVAATHADLYGMVAQGTFRQDLWYRISVFPIHLPPLRDRPADIPAFAAHFAARAGRRLGGTPLVPTLADVALLQQYAWPGNVRELAAVIERAAILGNGRHLEVTQALGPPPGPTPVAPATPAVVALRSLDQVTVAHVTAALTASLGRVEGPFGAARTLGVNPHTLRSRMRKLGIDLRQYRRPR